MGVRLFVRNVFIIIAIVVIIGTQQQASSQKPEIYGMRWSIGDHYSFTKPSMLDQNQYFVLMFNSDQQIKGDLLLHVGWKEFFCSSFFLTTKAVEDHHSDINTNASKQGDIEETYVHKCIVNTLAGLSEEEEYEQLYYELQVGNYRIREDVTSEYQVVHLFNGTFRVPRMGKRMDMVVIGDWGVITKQGEKKGYHHVEPCLELQISKNKDIKMLLFTGDMAYDLQGPHYRSMLKLISSFSSKIAFMVTPGNHDTLKHADTYQLFTASFYMPRWKTYFNYFYVLKLGQVVITAYNPEVSVYPSKNVDRLKKDLGGIFREEFSQGVIEDIRNNYFSMVFSHYPIYCSDIHDHTQTCQKNMERLKSYRTYFQKMQLNLYISGHLHTYERSKPICFNGSISENVDDTVSFQCPVYIVEGAGGNDMYVQVEDLCKILIYSDPPKNFSAKLVYNTGFGVISIRTDIKDEYPTNISYHHFSSQKCQAKDQFLMINTHKTQGVPNQANQQSGFRKFADAVVKLAFISLGIVCLVLIAYKVGAFIYGKLGLSRNETDENNHVEMVEENDPKSQKGHKITT